MAKQDKSKFQLNKGTDHGFDISKGSKRRFDLTKDVDEPIATPVAKPQPTNPVTPTPSTPDTQKKNNKWLWIIFVVIVIILLIWWLLPGKSSDSEPMGEGESTEAVTAPTEDTEGGSDDAAIPVAESAAVETVNNDGTSTPSSPAANTPEAESGSAQNSSDVNNNNASTTVSNDIEAEALKVIRGEYGIGQERKNKLGNQYEAIQRRVNELKREGVF